MPTSTNHVPQKAKYSQQIFASAGKIDHGDILPQETK